MKNMLMPGFEVDGFIQQVEMVIRERLAREMMPIATKIIDEEIAKFSLSIFRKVVFTDDLSRISIEVVKREVNA